jgi:acetyl-CoA C-acetyltransferase
MTNPLKEVDVWEPYDPFTYKELHHLDGLLGKPLRRSWRLERGHEG